MQSMIYNLSRAVLVLLITGLLGVSVAYGQSATMSYQGYLTDADGDPLGGTANLSFALYDGATGGTALWEESQTNVPLSDGVFSVMLGSVESLAGVHFEGPLYLGVTVNGGSELAPRVRLGVAPASLYAYTIADGLAVRSINGLMDEVTLQAGDNITLTEADGTLTIDAEAAEAFTLPFEGVNDTNDPALKITSSAASGLVVNAEGGAPAISASSNSTGAAAAFGQVSSTSQASAIDAFSFSLNATGVFSHFGSQGYAGIFRSTNPVNTFPALVAGKEDLDINSDDFFNDGLIVQGDAPILGVYGRFQQNTRPGLVLAGVNDDGDLVDKWGIVREFFGTQRLMFTYGLDPDPGQNPIKMSLSNVADGTSLSVPNGTISTSRLQATDDLGESATPAEGGMYKDNVVYAWAEVGADGTLVDGFGCTVSRRTGSGSYRVTFNRSLPNGVSAIVTPKGLNDVVLASVATNANFADVATKNFNGSAFVFFDSGFYIQVVGRP